MVWFIDMILFKKKKFMRKGKSTASYLIKKIIYIRLLLVWKRVLV